MADETLSEFRKWSKKLYYNTKDIRLMYKITKKWGKIKCGRRDIIQHTGYKIDIQN